MAATVTVQVPLTQPELVYAYSAVFAGTVTVSLSVSPQTSVHVGAALSVKVQWDSRWVRLCGG